MGTKGFVNMKCEQGFSGRSAAVLVPLLKAENGTEILLERRGNHLKKQPGEICLPGGRIHTKDGHMTERPEEAAIRETMEELLIEREQIKIVKSLPVQMGPDGCDVYPFVAELTGYQGTFSRNEVGEVLRIPAEFFSEKEPERYAVDLVTVPREGFPFERIPGGRNYPFQKKEWWISFYDYQGVTIWGLTAAILESFGKEG